MNYVKIGAALRALADAVDGGSSVAPGEQATPEPAKRGRGRPVKGEDTAPAAASAANTASAATAGTDGGAGAAITSPSEDPFAAARAATLDEVRTALNELKAATDQNAALKVLKDAGGAPNLTDLKPEKYGVVVAAAAVATRIAAQAKAPAQAAAEEDPFALPAGAAAPAETAPTLDDVRAAVIAASKRTGNERAAKVVMDLGGKAPKEGAPGGFGPSWTALPKEKYAEAIDQLKALPTTK